MPGISGVVEGSHLLIPMLQWVCGTFNTDDARGNEPLNGFIHPYYTVSDGLALATLPEEEDLRDCGVCNGL